ncbi:MAG TPA: hypothetical protein VGQ83_17190 [Polyangia bacterium]|jgi:hypothetical protein
MVVVEATRVVLHEHAISGVMEVHAATGATVRDESAWQKYLTRLQETGRLSEEHVAHTRSFWRHVRVNVSPWFPFPQAMPGPGDRIQLSWDRGAHHVDVDIFPTGRYEWFYRDGGTGSFEGAEDCDLTRFPARLAECLRRVS